MVFLEALITVTVIVQCWMVGIQGDRRMFGLDAWDGTFSSLVIPPPTPEGWPFKDGIPPTPQKSPTASTHDPFPLGYCPTCLFVQSEDGNLIPLGQLPDIDFTKPLKPLTPKPSPTPATTLPPPGSERNEKIFLDWSQEQYTEFSKPLEPWAGAMALLLMLAVLVILYMKYQLAGRLAPKTIDMLLQDRGRTVQLEGRANYDRLAELSRAILERFKAQGVGLSAYQTIVIKQSQEILHSNEKEIRAPLELKDYIFEKVYQMLDALYYQWNEQKDALTSEIEVLNSKITYVEAHDDAGCLLDLETSPLDLEKGDLLAEIRRRGVVIASMKESIDDYALKMKRDRSEDIEEIIAQAGALVSNPSRGDKNKIWVKMHYLQSQMDGFSAQMKKTETEHEWKIRDSTREQDSMARKIEDLKVENARLLLSRGVEVAAPQDSTADNNQSQETAPNTPLDPQPHWHQQIKLAPGDEISSSLSNLGPPSSSIMTPSSPIYLNTTPSIPSSSPTISDTSFLAPRKTKWQSSPSVKEGKRTANEIHWNEEANFHEARAQSLTEANEKLEAEITRLTARIAIAEGTEDVTNSVPQTAPPAATTSLTEAAIQPDSSRNDQDSTIMMDQIPSIVEKFKKLNAKMNHLGAPERFQTQHNLIDRKADSSVDASARLLRQPRSRLNDLTKPEGVAALSAISPSSASPTHPEQPQQPRQQLQTQTPRSDILSPRPPPAMPPTYFSSPATQIPPKQPLQQLQTSTPRSNILPPRPPPAARTPSLRPATSLPPRPKFDAPTLSSKSQSKVAARSSRLDGAAPSIVPPQRSEQPHQASKPEDEEKGGAENRDGGLLKIPVRVGSKDDPSAVSYAQPKLDGEQNDEIVPEKK